MDLNELRETTLYFFLKAQPTMQIRLSQDCLHQSQESAITETWFSSYCEANLPDQVESTCTFLQTMPKYTILKIILKQFNTPYMTLTKWTKKWTLYFNDSKCRVMHLGKNNPSCRYKISHNNNKHILETCKEEKDLGVIFDSGLLFDNHINIAISKCNKMLGIIRRSFIG